MIKLVSRAYLKAHPKEILVFGDNTKRRGFGGAAILRDMRNTYGFITKRNPDHNPKSYYTCAEYLPIFEFEFGKLTRMIIANPDKTYLISRLGAGLANRNRIYENVIKPRIFELRRYINVRFLFDEND